MNIGTEEMGKPKTNLPYEQPSLKKYGTMKSLTLGQNGSGGDFNRTFGTSGGGTNFSNPKNSDIGSDNSTLD